MPEQLFSKPVDEPAVKPISPKLEMGAYEALWNERGATFKKIAEKFSGTPGSLPSDFVEVAIAYDFFEEATRILEQNGISKFGIRIHGTGDYPGSLRDAKNPVEFLYFRGYWEQSETKGIAIVGSRKASQEGLGRARRLARLLVESDYTVVSGLAAGIDTAAHLSALESGGRTIAVIGTPIGKCYPPENKKLQENISAEHLLISQVPIVRYAREPFSQHRFFFPERNKTMSALTEATVIVEASDTSGTLTQARAALYQGRKLFILNSCFLRKDITWPSRFEKEGAIRVENLEDILKNLA